LSDEREREELPFCLPAIVQSNCVQTKIFFFSKSQVMQTNYASNADESAQVFREG
jgi:hypothetical protein